MKSSEAVGWVCKLSLTKYNLGCGILHSLEFLEICFWQTTIYAVTDVRLWFPWPLYLLFQLLIPVLIVLSFCRFHIAVLHLIFIWCLKVRCWSAQTPKYFMQSLISILSPFMHILFVVVFDNCCLDQKMIISVLLLFIFN